MIEIRAFTNDSEVTALFTVGCRGYDELMSDGEILVSVLR